MQGSNKDCFSSSTKEKGTLPTTNQQEEHQHGINVAVRQCKKGKTIHLPMPDEIPHDIPEIANDPLYKNYINWKKNHEKICNLKTNITILSKKVKMY